MCRYERWIVMVSLTLGLLSSAPAFAAPKTTYTIRAGSQSWTKNKDGSQTCTATYDCNKSAAVSSHTYNLLTADRAPTSWSLLSYSITQPDGTPLMLGDTRVKLSRDHCSPGACTVDALHPAPPEQQWKQFISNMLPSPDGDATLSFNLTVTYDTHGDNPNGTVVGTWLSDNSDTLYGDTVEELFLESTLEVPTVSESGLIALIVVLAALAIYTIRRRRAVLEA